MQPSPFATPVQQAALCLRDDPSFRLLSDIEEQRAEARLLLQGIPGASVDDADEAIMLALESLDDAGGDASEIVDVAKADFAAGAWTSRKIRITRPKSASALPAPRPVARPAKKAKRPKGLSPSDKARSQTLDAGILGRFRAATGLSIESLGRILGKSRPTVQLYLSGTLTWSPTNQQLQTLRGLLDEQERLIETTRLDIEKALML
jgi:hypothetical protein